MPVLSSVLSNQQCTADGRIDLREIGGGDIVLRNFDFARSAL